MHTDVPSPSFTNQSYRQASRVTGFLPSTPFSSESVRIHLVLHLVRGILCCSSSAIVTCQVFLGHHLYLWLRPQLDCESRLLWHFPSSPGTRNSLHPLYGGQRAWNIFQSECLSCFPFTLGLMCCETPFPSCRQTVSTSSSNLPPLLITVLILAFAPSSCLQLLQQSPIIFDQSSSSIQYLLPVLHHCFVQLQSSILKTSTL